MSAALRITPSDDDKFLPVEAFDLEPRAPVGFVAAIDALRDDALDTVFAGQAMEHRPLPDLVIVVPQRFRRTFQQRFQSGFAVHQRQCSQVLAIRLAVASRKSELIV